MVMISFPGDGRGRMGPGNEASVVSFEPLSPAVSPHPYRYEYQLSREYNWNVKNKASKGYEV